jgi:hypothetical protein
MLPVPAIRPSLRWFWLAGAIFLVGATVGVVLLAGAAVSFVGRVDDFQRVPVPGASVVTLNHAGGYTVYLEYPGADSLADQRSVDVTLTPLSGGEPLPLVPYSSDVSYAFGAHEGVAFVSFHIDAPGQYRLTVQEGIGQVDEVAVGEGLGAGLGGAIVAGVLVGGISTLAAATMAIVTGVRRSTARRAQRLAAWATPQQPWGGQPQGWGPQPRGGAPPPPPRGSSERPFG